MEQAPWQLEGSGWESGKATWPWERLYREEWRQRGSWGKNGQGTFRTKIPSIAIGILAVPCSCNPPLFPDTFMSAILLLHDGGIVGRGGRQSCIQWGGWYRKGAAHTAVKPGKQREGIQRKQGLGDVYGLNLCVPTNPYVEA